MDKTHSLNNQEISDTASLLARLEPGFLPKDIFYQVARISALPILEMVPLRSAPDGRVEVLLLRRSADDPFWPNLWHNPGTVLRATDTLVTAFDRLVCDELEGVVLRGEPVFVETLLSSTERGRDVAQVYWAETAGLAPAGTYHSVDNLPPDIIKSSIDIIKTAAKAYALAKLLESERIIERDRFQQDAKNYIISSGV